MNALLTLSPLAVALMGATSMGGAQEAAPVLAQEPTPKSVPTAAAKTASKGYTLTTSMGGLYIDGESLDLTVEVVNGSGENVAIPLWAFTPAALEVDGRSLGERVEGQLLLAPGQRLSTTFDLVPALDGIEETHFALRHTLSVDPLEVLHLNRAEKGINFMELPLEQLGDYQVVMLTTAGPLRFELWPDVAPNHVRNFLDLSYSGFYDGSNFHRVMPGFMIQGGSATPERPAPRQNTAEFSTRRHVPGVLSAARLGNDVNSATSEFFVVHKAAPNLDGLYTAFGMLAGGMDVVESVVKAVDANHTLINELRKITMIDMDNPMVPRVLNRPNPTQSIFRAIVVKAPRKR